MNGNGNQLNPEQFEQVFTEVITTPVGETINRTVINVPGRGERILAEEVVQTVLGQGLGTNKTLAKKYYALDDGTPYEENARIIVCHRSHVVKSENAYKCACGKIVCSSYRCVKVLFGRAYCSIWHFILDRTIGVRWF